MSCLQSRGLDELADAIERTATEGNPSSDWTLAINARHAACLEDARRYLGAAIGAMDQGLSPEFIAEELRAAMNAVGDIVGRADPEELLGVIFSRFCIGK